MRWKAKRRKREREREKKLCFIFFMPCMMQSQERLYSIVSPLILKSGLIAYFDLQEREKRMNQRSARERDDDDSDGDEDPE